MDLRSQLLEAMSSHDLLQHPFYKAWSMGRLTRADLAAYAAQYQHQVDAFPSLLRAAKAGSRDGLTRAELQRNLDEEEGQDGAAHAALWHAFAQELGAPAVESDPETRASADALRALVASGEVEALAALFAYEHQTARVSATKREGLIAHYGVTSPAALSFFALHQDLDVHHADALLLALERACPDAAAQERGCAAAASSVRAQWLFLDGAESRRH